MFAYLALFSWPVIAAILFARLPIQRAAIWSLVAGYLLLPPGLVVDAPGIPHFDKNNMIVLATLLCCLAKGGPKPAGSVGLLLPFCAALYVLAPIAATFGNSYELHIGTLSLPGYYLMDGIKNADQNLVQISALYIGARYIANPTGRFELLKVWVTALLIYSIPVLIEARLSPQMNRWVYGFGPKGFSAVVRWGGYRPQVFLPQGIQLALFVAMAIVAACVLARRKTSLLRLPTWLPPVYLSGILIVCKTLGAVIYSVFLAPIALFCRPSTSVKVATAIMILVCIYPALRSQQLVPVDSIVEMAGSVSADREASLVTRITNENVLLAKANQKPLFGWGGWSRNRVYLADESKDVSITDGGWIIFFGVFGWFGYVGLFGMFAAPIFRLNRYVRGADHLDARIAACLGLILAMNMFDMLPNANMTPITFLLAGAIARTVKPVGAARPLISQASQAPVGLKAGRIPDLTEA